MNLKDLTTSIYDLFNNNPLLNLISLLLAILGIVFTIYFYFKSKKSRLPVYIIRTINLVKEKFQKIDTVQILYSGEKVNNLSISKIAFWNDGKETIDSSNVAINHPLKLNISEEFDILYAEILFQKNNSNDFKIDISEDNKSISIIFDFFDYEDGIVLQLFHTGNSSDDLSISGTIKSVKNIRRKEINYSILPLRIFEILNGNITKIKRKTMIRILGWVTILVGILFCTISFYNPHKLEPVTENSPFFNIILPLLGIPYIYLGYKMLIKHIPKGFDIFNEEF
ncbi:hypothetical protein [uncultured Mucilaginibacter sp.]|uniref:hypothetical protein n=1 Tax=uncultured Mucilaginibacter sp. TaxID=797541 RepID=UPI002619A97C|nr:hypothetical protein [uncultured Mucilaginibacter sp.]